MIEMARETRVLTVLAGTLIGTIMMIPPNFWTDIVWLASGYLIPQVFLAIIFALIAFFSGGTLGGGVVARLTAFVSKVTTKLAAAGRAGVILLRIFDFMSSLTSKMVDLIKALRRKVAEVSPGATGEATPVVLRTTPRVPPKRLPHHRSDIPDEYYDPDTGELLWPNEETTGIRDGFAKPPVAETLPEGTIIDCYAPRSGVDDTGKFLSPAGASYESRALPYVENADNLTRYRVARPLPVQSGTAAPWFGAPGGATQFKTGPSVGQLVQDGFLEVIP